jgi:hypothetical protein
MRVNVERMIEPWENKNRAATCGNTKRPLTRSLDLREEGLAMQATRICSVTDCQKPRCGKSRMCSMHLARWRRHGTTDSGRNMSGTLAERYERFVVRRPDGCWDWVGAVNNSGYGKLGRAYAHRVSYEIHHGPIPTGMFVIHSCDNPPCTNPAHLRAGTAADNMADANSRGRLLGSPSSGQKITIEQAREIKRLRAAGWTRRQVSERFGIHMDNITEITSGRMWADA